jgi:hypothetical protein
LLVVAFLLATIFEDFLVDSIEYFGLLVMLSVLLYTGFYQIIFSFFSVLIYRSKSVFRNHLLGSIIFFVLVGLVSYGIEEHFYNDSLERFVKDNEILVGVLSGLVPVGLLIYYYSISFDRLNPYKLYR